MSNIPNYSISRDRSVKLLQNGTPVSNSTAASQYARPLNLTGSGVTATPNDTLGTFDVNIPGTTVPIQSVANVGTGAGTIYRDTTSNTANLKTISAGSGITVTNNANDVNIATTTTNSQQLSPVIGPKWGMFVGGSGHTNSSGGTSAGSGFMSNWQAVNLITDGVDANGSYKNFTTGGSSGNVTEYYSSTDNSSVAGIQNVSMWARFLLPNVTNIRLFFLYTDFNVLPTNTSDPLGSAQGFGLRYDSNADGNFKLLNNNGASSSTVTDLGITPAINTVYTLQIFAENINSRWGCILNGGPTVYQTSKIPAMSYNIGFDVRIQTQTSAAKNLYLYYLYGQMDH